MAAIQADALVRDVELSIQRRSDQPSLVMPDGPLVFPAKTTDAAGNGDLDLGIFIAEMQGLHAAVQANLIGTLPPILDEIEAMEGRLNALLS